MTNTKKSKTCRLKLKKGFVVYGIVGAIIYSDEHFLALSIVCILVLKLFNLFLTSLEMDKAYSKIILLMYSMCRTIRTISLSRNQKLT
jgi:hypothetical protein